MLYVFFVVACLCSNYMVAMNKEQQERADQRIYCDKLISEIKDDKERAQYKDGYIVLDNAFIVPSSEFYIAVPIGKDGCFMSLPYSQAMPILEDIKNKEEMKNNNQLVMSK